MIKTIVGWLRKGFTKKERKVKTKITTADFFMKMAKEGPQTVSNFEFID